MKDCVLFLDTGNLKFLEFLFWCEQQIIQLFLKNNTVLETSG